VREIQVQKCVDSIIELPATAASIDRDHRDRSPPAGARPMQHDPLDEQQLALSPYPQGVRLETSWARILYQDLFSAAAANDAVAER
jgi:hypothetical protein